MAVPLVAGSQKRASLVVVFGPAAIFVGAVMALEDSIIAEIVPGSRHGLAYGKLAFSNAVGDLVSGVLLRGAWTAPAPKTAFATTRASFAAAGKLILILWER
jgi:hypothetical protein